MDDQFCYLPPGFRFRPTDEEIITHYLINKIADQNFFSLAISQANFNDCEPWDLPRKAKMGDKEWYFFCQIDRKYPTGMRTNRATKAGYWKTTGKDKEIFKGKGVVGKKKTLVFYQGRAPRGQRTNWVMQEYRLEGKQQAYYNLCTPKMDWVVCKVYHKTKDTNSNSSKKLPSKMSSSADNMLAENTNMTSLLHSTCFNPSNQELEVQQVLENDFKKSIFSSQSYLLYCPWSLHQEKGNLRAPFISNQGKVGSNTERNGEASSAISMHQICSLHYSDAQVLDFDSIMNYESL